VLSACPHFLSCGGCVDVSPKDDRLPQALTAAGFGATVVQAIAVSPPNTRRRMDLAARRTASGVQLGLHRHRSHDIVDLHVCYVLHPDLVALFDPLRGLLNRLELLRRDGSVVANRLDNGVDLLLRTDRAASAQDRTRLAEFAAAHGVARVSHAVGNALPETLAALRAPCIRLSGVLVLPPPGAFLQATAGGEAAIVGAVLAGLPAKLARRDRIAELYAGCGTLSYALERHARVDAFEGDPAALAALDRACRDAGLGGRIVPVLRDLVRQPLMARELAPYAVVVLDPPAQGALAQIAEVVQAGVKRVIYVSCDPQSLARDAAVLRGAGYDLVAATPVDQFIGSPRVESICVFNQTSERGDSHRLRRQ
jgi:23S rRNA (uracil1939-C5)-methyltransferase